MAMESTSHGPKDGPSKSFKPMEVEIPEIVEEILEKGGLLVTNGSGTHYFVWHEESDLDPQESRASNVVTHFSDHLVLPQMAIKRRKVNCELVIDYIHNKYLH